jgi:hypothetical protein
MVYQVTKKPAKCKFPQFCNESENKGCIDMCIEMDVKLISPFDFL